MKDNDSVITGMGCLCAAGSGLEITWDNMIAGHVNPSLPTKFQAESKRLSPVFEVSVDKCSESNIMLRGNTERTFCVNLFLIALEEALIQASLTIDDLFGKKIGVSVGTTVGCTLNDEQFYREFKSGSKPRLVAIERFLANNPAHFVSEALNLRGPVCTINNACSSGTDAIGQAKEWINDGLCNIVVAGGTDELSRIPYLGFTSLQNTSEQTCMPFDAQRDGLNLGEGAGALIIESRKEANKRNAKALVEVLGYGCCTDAFHQTAPHPQGEGLEQAIHQALCNCDPHKVSFVNTHGTGTVPNDRVEGKTLARLFSANVPVVSTKSYTGHTLGAAGALEAIFTAKGLMSGKIPSTAGFSEPDPECVVIPSNEVTEIAQTYAISTSLAFGGNNSCLLFKVVK